MLNNMKKSMAVLATLAVVVPANVEARSFGEIYTECGIGAMVFGSVGGDAGTVLAAISNITWDLGTTASTSNLSSEGTCSGSGARAAAFIHTNYASVEKDIASGSGKYIETLVAISKSSTQSKEEFITKLRTGFSHEVASSDYTTLTNYEKTEKLYNIIY